MWINVFTVLLALSVLFGIKAVWTSRLQVSARKQIVGPLARTLGWWMISIPLIAAIAVAVCIGALKLLNFDNRLAYGQGIIFGIVIVLLAAAYVASAVRKHGVPIRKEAVPLDWTKVEVEPSTPDFGFLAKRDASEGRSSEGT
jgi:hypothetical protein